MNGKVKILIPCSLTWQSKDFNTMNEEEILFYVLFDFLRELPETFDREKTTYSEAIKIIRNFMKRHKLADENGRKENELD